VFRPQVHDQLAQLTPGLALRLRRLLLTCGEQQRDDYECDKKN
jgi:hypothetical protein